MKKVSFVASMLLVALSTAGAMVAGQSFAEPAKSNCVSTYDYSKLTPAQIKELFPSG